MNKLPVTFLARYQSYQAGETAGFEEAEAKALVKDGVAVPFGDAGGVAVADDPLKDPLVKKFADQLTALGGADVLTDGGADVVPEGVADVVPEGGANTVPEGGADTVPEGGSDTVPEGGTDSVTDGGTDTVTKEPEKVSDEPGAPPAQGGKAKRK